MAPRVKICCIQNAGEARLAVETGASLVGLVSAMPSGPGPIPEERIAAVAATVPPGVTTVLLTSLREVEAIARQHRRLAALGRRGGSSGPMVRALQLVDRLAPGDLRALRGELPGVALIQVIHVTGAEALEEAREAAEDVDALLLDSGNPRAPVKELGGTGRTHDWEVSRRIREAVPVPVFLAGGLHAGNAAEGVRRVRPAGVDVCTGVRTRGALDPVRLRAFFAAVRGAASPARR